MSDSDTFVQSSVKLRNHAIKAQCMITNSSYWPDKPALLCSGLRFVRYRDSLCLRPLDSPVISGARSLGDAQGSAELGPAARAKTHTSVTAAEGSDSEKNIKRRECSVWYRFHYIRTLVQSLLVHVCTRHNPHVFFSQLTISNVLVRFPLTYENVIY